MIKSSELPCALNVSEAAMSWFVSNPCAKIRNSKSEIRRKLERKKRKAVHGNCKRKNCCGVLVFRLCEKEKLPDESNVLVAMRDQRTEGKVRFVVVKR